MPGDTHGFVAKVGWHFKGQEVVDKLPSVCLGATPTVITLFSVMDTMSEVLGFR